MRKYHIVSFVGLVLLASNVWGAVSIDQVRRQAQAYYREGRYPEAITLYRKMTVMEPRNAGVLKEVMWGFWNMQQFDLATQTAQQVLKIQKDDKEAQNVLSWSPRAANREKMFDLRDKAVKNYQAGRYEQAVEFYRQLVDIDANNVATMKDYLWALWSAERYDLIKPTAERILKLQPDDSATKDILAKLPEAVFRKKLATTASAASEAQNRSDFENAIGSYQDLIRLKPDDPKPIRSLAWTYYKLQRFAEAKDMARKLTALQPADPTSWNVLGRMQEACDELESAIESYEMSLKLDPTQLDTQAQLGKLYVRLRDLDLGVSALERVRASGHATLNVYPLLAKALFYKEEYAKSAEVWAEAFTKQPTHFEFRYFEAQARFYAGQPLGMKQMEELSNVYQYEHATQFLVNEARARGDNVTAQQLMEKLVPEILPTNISDAMSLAALYQTMGQMDKCLKVLERVAAVFPEYARPLVIEGSIYRQRQLFDKAAAMYRKALKINPNYAAARLGLAQSEFSVGHWDSALEEIRKLRKLDPANPYYVLREGRFLYETGQQDQSRKLLMDWVNQTSKEPLLPVLLYHGLTPLKQDPRLAVGGNYRLDIFSDHIRALHDSGYTSVTTQDVADWLEGKKGLPPKPVLVTFDDGRLDALRYADPVLEKYGYKATMFSTLANAGGARPIAYASWPQLLGYQQNGRWEIQSHGDQAHTPIPIDEYHKGLFIANKRWVAERGDYETAEEWRARVFKDHEDSRKEIGAKTGQIPLAYAYAEGEYGQNQTNYPEAALENLTLVKQVYRIGFVEDNYGVNARNQDPIRIVRIEPEQNWSGDELVTHLQDENGRVFIYQELLHQAMWQGRTREAYRWLTRLQDAGVSERILWGEEARIRYAAGDVESGYDLASRVLTYSPEHFEQMIQQNLAKEGPAWNPGLLFAKDSRERESYIFEQRFELPRMGGLNFYLAHRWARFLETGYPSITDNGGGFGLEYRPGLFHAVELDVRGHDLSGAAHNMLSGNGSLESQWTDTIMTRVEAAHDMYFTARAISANIEQSIGGALVEWQDRRWWAVRLRGRYFSLSDTNRRRQFQGQLSRTIDSKERLRLTYRFTSDDMNNLSPFYYSPQQLILNEIGPQVSLKFWNHLTLTGTYRAGLGKETTTHTELTQDAQVQLRWMLSTRASIAPSYWYQKTPTYRQETLGLFFRYRFGALENMGVPIEKEKEEFL